MARVPAGHGLAVPLRADPTIEDTPHFRQRNRLRHVIVHNRGKASLGLTRERVRGQGHDGQTPRRILLVADRFREVIAVQVRHVAVGQQQGVASGAPKRQGHRAVLGDLARMPQKRQLTLHQEPIGEIVLGDQDRRADLARGIGFRSPRVEQAGQIRAVDGPRCLPRRPPGDQRHRPQQGFPPGGSANDDMGNIRVDGRGISSGGEQDRGAREIAKRARPIVHDDRVGRGLARLRVFQ